MLYDHISLHDDTAPDALPKDKAQHMGYYLAWAMNADLLSDVLCALPEFAALKSGEMKAVDFIIHVLHGGFDSVCFNPIGQRFTEYYYVDEDEGYGHFLSDYFQALGLESMADFYQVEDLPEYQAILNGVFQVAFEQWRSSLK